MEYRREIAVVYTVEEALEKVNTMRQHGFSEHEIHLFAKDARPLHALKMYTDIDVHQAGSLLDKILSIVWQIPLYEVCLRMLHFSAEERFHYGQLIAKGAIFMIAQHDYPFEKQPKKEKNTFSLKKASVNSYYDHCQRKLLQASVTKGDGASEK